MWDTLSDRKSELDVESKETKLRLAVMESFCPSFQTAISKAVTFIEIFDDDRLRNDAIPVAAQRDLVITIRLLTVVTE
jgi:hypothetical protein